VTPGEPYLNSTRSRAILVVFLVVYGFFQLLFIFREQVPTLTDSTIHLINTIQFHQILSGPHYPGRLVELLSLDKGNVFPPLAYITTALVYMVGGSGRQWAMASQVVFLLLLLASTYGLARRIWNPATGLLAMFLTATTPLLVDISRLYYLEIAGSAATALALYCLVRAESLTRRNWTLAAGLALAMVVLARWETLIIAGSALLFEGVRAVREVIPDHPRRILAILAGLGALIFLVVVTALLSPLAIRYPAMVFCLVAVAGGAAWFGLRHWEGRLAGKLGIEGSGRLIGWLQAVLTGSLAVSPWILLNWPYLLSRAHLSGIYSGAENNPAVFSWVSITYYIYHSLYSMLALPWGILFLVGLILTLSGPTLRRRHSMLLWSLALGYIGYTLVGDKEVRYIIAMLPAMAVIMAFWPLHWSPGRVGAVALIILLGLFQWLGWLLPLPLAGEIPHWSVNLPAPVIPASYLAQATAYRSFYLMYPQGPPLLVAARPPLEEPWPFQDQVEELHHRLGERYARVLIVYGPAYRMFDTGNFQVHALARKWPCRFVEPGPFLADGGQNRPEAMIIYASTRAEMTVILAEVKRSVPEANPVVLREDPLPFGGISRVYRLNYHPAGKGRSSENENE